MTSSIMVFLGAFPHGAVYDEIGRHAGMGAALPITGFANSVVCLPWSTNAKALCWAFLRACSRWPVRS